MTLVAAAIYLCILDSCQSSARDDGANHAAGSENAASATDTVAQRDTAAIAPLAEISDDIRELLIDLLAYNACDFLQNRVFALAQKGGASARGGVSPTVGDFWIRSCAASQIDSQHVKISIAGIGWKWISRTRTRAGAEFELDEYVKFQVDVATTGTVDLAYNQQTHVATAYFVPVAPIDVRFGVTADVDVLTEELWSSIVGTAATAVGPSLEQRARESIRKKGSRQFQSRLDHGLTIILDLCTGQRYTRFGTFPPGQLPESAAPAKGMNFQANSAALLHMNGILMAGPFAADTPLMAYVEIDSGGPVSVAWIHNSTAEKTAKAYVSNKPPPAMEPIDQQIARAGEPVTMQAGPGLERPVVLVMKPARIDSITSRFLYRVYYEGDVRKPLAACEQ